MVSISLPQVDWHLDHQRRATEFLMIRLTDRPPDITTPPACIPCRRKSNTRTITVWTLPKRWVDVQGSHADAGASKFILCDCSK
jgi:hypothetical protein